jgi:uncharacterized membrane protein YhaH (DUF805 family)
MRMGPWEGGFAVLYLAFLVVFIVAMVRVLQKAGYSGAWVLVGLIPVVNVIMFVVFAFSDWPALRQRPGPPGTPPRPA